MKAKFFKAIKLSGVFFGLAFLILTGFGCKGLSTQQQAATKPVVLEFWTVFDDVDALRKLADSYVLKRNYLTINIRQLRYDEIYGRFVEALADDKGPDIISVNNRSLGKYLPRLQTMPSVTKDTTVIVEKGKFSDTVNVYTVNVPMTDLNKMKSEFVQTVYADAIRDKKIYGLPLSTDALAVYYNKDLLDRAGIPEPPKTWEEFQAAVKKLTKFDKASGKILQAGAAFGTGSNVPASSDILYVLFAQSKVPFVDSSGQVIFNRKPQNYGGGTLPSDQIMSFYTDFANPARDTYTWNESMPNGLDSFINGQTAFFFGYSYQYSIIKSRAPQLNFAVVPLFQLSDENKFNSANYWLLSVPSKSKHSNEAWNFIDFVARSKANKAYLDSTGRPSALRVNVADQLQKPELSPFLSQILVASNWYRGVDFDAADKAIQTMFTEWLKPIPETAEASRIKSDILDRAALKINQTIPIPK